MRRGNVRILWLVAVLAVAPISTGAHNSSGAEWILGTTGAESRVQFDTAAVIACRDVTTLEFAEEHPGDRLLEATIEISMLRRATRDFGVEYVVQVVSPNRTIQVTDYSPKTHVESGIDGTVAIEQTSEGTASVGVDAGGIFDHIANINGHASVGGRSSSIERYEETPNHQVVLASGIMQRGSGVYYKVRSSPTTTVEGGRRFTFRFRASESWRGDRLHVYCQGYKQIERSSQSSRTGNVIGRGQFVVAAFLAGDGQSKRIADDYADAEFQLRQAAVEHRQTAAESGSNSVLRRVGLAFHADDARLPSHWPNLVIFGNPIEAEQLIEKLPDELVPFVGRWREARNSIDAMAAERL